MKCEPSNLTFHQILHLSICILLLFPTSNHDFWDKILYVNIAYRSRCMSINLDVPKLIVSLLQLIHFSTSIPHTQETLGFWKINKVEYHQETVLA